MTKKQEEFMGNNELETQIEEGYRNLTKIAIIIAVFVILEIALIILLRLGLV